MQNREKISPSRSSDVNSPVIDAIACCAMRNSSANNSSGRQISADVRTRAIDVRRGIPQREQLALAGEERVFARVLDAGDSLHDQPRAHRRRRRSMRTTIRGNRLRVTTATRWTLAFIAAHVRRDAGEITFVVDDDARQRRRQLARERFDRVFARGVARIHDEQRDVGTRDRRPRSRDAQLLDDIDGVAKARGVDNGQRDAGDLDLPLDGVARRARDRGDDRRSLRATSRLSRLDFPTLGAPTSTTVRPSRSATPALRAQGCAASRCRMDANRSRTSPSRSRSMSSSGKSSVASVYSAQARSAHRRNACTSRENSPLRLRAAARAAVAVAASITSATLSACTRIELAVEERALA